MKKFLLLMMCCPLALAAQNGVTVSNLDVKPGIITFNVSWDKNAMPEDFLWSDTVWVFVDYNNAGRTERLLLSGATLLYPTWSAASVTFDKAGNYTGAWVVGNARSAGSFSATVMLLTATVDISGACAYASNYPPVGEYIDATHISFTGTPPYDLVLASAGSSTRTISINDSYCNLYEGETLKSFSDKTGAPGIIKCIVPANPVGVSNSRCGGGEITISAAPTEPGAVIDWYDAASGGTLLLSGNNTYTTPSITTSTTYYAQARIAASRCESSSRTPVIAAVDTKPNLTLSSGTATVSQTVTWNSPIADIIYTVADPITTLSWSLPDGLNITLSNASVTISGPLVVVESCEYTVTATHANGCASHLTGTLTTYFSPPPHAASTQTWLVTGPAGVQLWSEPINVKACDKTSFAPSGSTGDCRNNGAYPYLYSLYYVWDNSTTLCPSPWSIADYAAFCTLYKNLYNDTSCANVESAGAGSKFLELWPDLGGGYIGPDGEFYEQDKAYYTNGDSGGWRMCSWIIGQDVVKYIYGSIDNKSGLQVRCVHL
jgi:hypothetical protein